MSILSVVLALVLAFPNSGTQEQVDTPLTALFDGQVGLSFQTMVQPGGALLGWGGAVLTSRGQGAHRVVLDSRGEFFLIYRINVEPLDRPQHFRLSIEPPDAEAVFRFKQSMSSDSRQFEIANYPPPQEISFGDVVTLEILEDPTRKVKIVDLLHVVDPLRDARLGLAAEPPRDFTLADVELKMTDYELKVDGWVYESGGGCSGAVIWFYFPEYGRFLFSIVDRPGYGFQRIGMVRDNRITFSYQGTQFEWISSEPVLQTGAWHLWVRPDPDYRPPIAPLPGSAIIGAADAIGSLLEPER